MGGQDVSSVAGKYQADAAIAIGSNHERIGSAKLEEISATTYGRGALLVGDGRPNTSVAFLSGFEISGVAPTQSRVVPGSKPLAPKLEAAVDKIEESCNGGLTGIGTDVSSLWNTLAPLNKEEYAQVNERFAQKYGKNYASRGAKWDIDSELKDELSDADLTRFHRMIADKAENDVPAKYRTSGESLLKRGAELKVGEMNRVELGGGRDYDVYIPRNADSRAPVVVAMAGAGLGDMKGVMAVESGLTIEAEKTGSIVVFAYPKVRAFQGRLGSNDGVAWNVPDRTNLPKQTDSSYDDRVYMDNVLKDLGNRGQMAGKIGMMGFSDGGRFAEIYAADRPERVAGVVAMSGTWMEGDRKPVRGVPIMIVHGDADEMLPYNGGMGKTSSRSNWFVPNNLDQSKPFMQAKVWSQAAGGDGTVAERVVHGEVEERDYNAGTGTVKEYIIKGADHGMHDYKNNGSRFWQWMLGEPDLKQDMVTKGAGFLKGYIVRDVAGS